MLEVFNQAKSGLLFTPSFPCCKEDERQDYQSTRLSEPTARCSGGWSNNQTARDPGRGWGRGELDWLDSTDETRRDQTRPDQANAISKMQCNAQRQRAEGTRESSSRC